MRPRGVQFAAAVLVVLTASVGRAESLYEFRIEAGWLRMRDGVELSVTYFRPVPKWADEKFPALLEMLPYRKDDSFYMRDYPLYAYFAVRGFLMAKVDVRGTGSSRGALPSREYSDEEIEDAVECVGLLSRLPGGNGKVGMWGISWGGFNAIQTAMRHPPALAATLAVDASDDLYHDDIHYLDGCFHVDRYALSIAQDVAMPRGPDYALDESYFRERFDRPPWLLTVLRQSTDGPFWQRGSLRRDYGALRVPAYLIGGLLDFYRDSVPRMLERVRAPVTGVIGPWNHTWPDNGTPGPNFEWRRELVAWWNRWLRGTRGGEPADRHSAPGAGSCWSDPGEDALAGRPGEPKDRRSAPGAGSCWSDPGEDPLARRPDEPTDRRSAPGARSCWSDPGKDQSARVPDDPGGGNLAVFVRDYHPPDAKLETTPEHWRLERWPIERTGRRTLLPTASGQLLERPGPGGVHALEYVPDCGTAADVWWGEPTPDMRPDDACGLVYDSEPVTATLEVIGAPRVWLAAAASRDHAHWVARLEDVAPGGAVTLVTGGALNGAQRRSRLRPERLRPGRFEEFLLPLHFTTWTLRPGHRIRLAITNAQFPMIWPVEGPLTTALRVGTSATRLELPIVPFESRPAPGFGPPEPRARRPDARELPSPGWPARFRVVREAGTTRVEWYGADRYAIRDRVHRQEEMTVYAVRAVAPASPTFHGDATHAVEWPGRSLRLRTRIDVATDAATVRATVRRQVFENGRLVREKLWREVIPRGLR